MLTKLNHKFGHSAGLVVEYKVSEVIILKLFLLFLSISVITLELIDIRFIAYYF